MTSLSNGPGLPAHSHPPACSAGRMSSCRSICTSAVVLQTALCTLQSVVCGLLTTDGTCTAQALSWPAACFTGSPSIRPAHSSSPIPSRSVLHCAALLTAQLTAHCSLLTAHCFPLLCCNPGMPYLPSSAKRRLTSASAARTRPPTHPHKLGGGMRYLLARVGFPLSSTPEIAPRPIMRLRHAGSDLPPTSGTQLWDTGTASDACVPVPPRASMVLDLLLDGGIHPDS